MPRSILLLSFWAAVWAAVAACENVQADETSCSQHLYKPAPKYPAEAINGHWEAKLVVKAQVNERCKVDSVEIQELTLTGGPPPERGEKRDEKAIRAAFEKSARETVLTWQFYDGPPLGGYTLVPISFSLNDEKANESRIVFAVKPSMVGSLYDETGTYIDDATIASKVPQLKNASKRSSTCFSSMTVPESLHITYSPQVIGAHTAQARVLNCSHERGSDELVCNVAPAGTNVYFDEAPDRYFGIDDSIRLDEALSFFHALLTRQLRFAAGVPDQKLGEPKGYVGTISKQGNRLQFGFGNCNAAGNMQAEQKQDKNGVWYYEAISSGWQFEL